MIITINIYECSDSLMSTEYELTDITQGLINVGGKPTEKAEWEEYLLISGKTQKRLLVSCESIENGIKMIESELSDNFHRKQLINKLKEKRI